MALLAVIVIGVLLARRWHVAGALVVAFGAGLLGYAASVQYSAGIAVTIAAGLGAGTLLWLEWHRRTTCARPRRRGGDVGPAGRRRVPRQ